MRQNRSAKSEKHNACGFAESLSRLRVGFHGEVVGADGMGCKRQSALRDQTLAASVRQAWAGT